MFFDCKNPYYGCKDRGLNLLAKYFINFLNPCQCLVIGFVFSEYIDNAGLLIFYLT